MDQNVIIIAEDERLAYKVGASTIYYRRISPARARVFRETHTAMGQVNQDALAKDVLDYSITGWSGVFDSRGDEVIFTPDKVDALPGRIRNDLINRITDGDHFEELVKN